MTNDSPSKTPWPFNIGIPQRFSERYERYQQLGGLVDITDDARAYAGDAPLGDIERLIFLSLAFDQIHKEGLDGDFVELGVYQGATAAVLARYARRLHRNIYLLDTYEGFAQRDFSGLDAGRDRSFSDTSLGGVRARVGEENAVFIKGYFPETARDLPEDGQYCLVHIDTDLYAPIMSGLEYFYPRMVPGGFLIIHDYGSLVWEGAEKAVDRFFADKPECVIQIPDSSGSVVVRRQRQKGDSPSWIAKKQTLAMNAWHLAANGQLSSNLTDGWSSPEDWGLWGVGSRHQIKLMTNASANSLFAVDIDVHAFVWDDAGRTVDIFVNDRKVDVVVFTKENSSRSLSLEFLRAASDGSLTVEFRPQTVEIVRSVMPLTNETRELGVALHRIRLRLSGA